MGYTHYFRYDPQAESYVAAWPTMLDDARKIVAAANVPLTGGVGRGEPEFNERWIWLNGVGNDGHETFLIHGPGEEAGKAIQDQRRWLGNIDFVWQFCKTAQKPYDLVVTAILLRCAQLAPDAFTFSSDGNWDEDWLPGRALVRELFGTDERPEAARGDFDGTTKLHEPLPSVAARAQAQ